MKHTVEKAADQQGKTGWVKRFVIVCLVIVSVLWMALLISVISLRWVNPPVTAFTLLEDWEELGVERYNLRDRWVSQDQFPHHLTWAMIASEDQNFKHHWGFDIESIREVVEERRTGKRRRGASTISQQVAKNLYLWPGESYLRKGIEAGITLMIEIFWSKDRIMEMYLNIVEFGPGVFGVGKASEVFFGIPPSHLEPDMSARLAAVLPSPKRMRVEPPSPFAKERSEWILRQISHLTGISYIPPAAQPENDVDPMTREFNIDFELEIQAPAIINGVDTLQTD